MCTQNVNVDSSAIDIGFYLETIHVFCNLLLRFTHKRFYTPLVHLMLIIILKI